MVRWGFVVILRQLCHMVDHGNRKVVHGNSIVVKILLSKSDGNSRCVVLLCGFIKQHGRVKV